MAFKERVFPNWNGGTPRERIIDPAERRDPSPQLTPAQRLAALKHAREHRISLSEAIRLLFGD